MTPECAALMMRGDAEDEEGEDAVLVLSSWPRSHLPLPLLSPSSLSPRSLCSHTHTTPQTLSVRCKADARRVGRQAAGGTERWHRTRRRGRSSRRRPSTSLTSPSSRVRARRTPDTGPTQPLSSLCSRLLVWSPLCLFPFRPCLVLSLALLSRSTRSLSCVLALALALPLSCSPSALSCVCVCRRVLRACRGWVLTALCVCVGAVQQSVQAVQPGRDDEHYQGHRALP
eukprot:2711470-Rhodomonas_salina.1